MDLKILIVDDEEIICSGIQMKIERVFPSATVVGLAQDAIEGLELFKKHNPNVIITDIRMPEIDGLKFIEMVKEINSDVQFIIVSGYQDFKYAQNAIRLGVNDYLLKPIENDDLQRILNELSDSLQKKTSSEAALSDLMSKAKSGTDYLKNKYLSDLISYGTDFEAKQVIKNLDIIGLKFPYEFFTAITITISEFEDDSSFSNKSDMSITKFAIQNISEELLSSLGSIAAFEHTKDEKQVIVIVNHKHLMDNSQQSEVVSLCNKLINSINRYLKLSVSIGIGKGYASLLNISISYSESYTASMHKLTLGKNKVISIDQVPDSNRIDFFLCDESKILLLNYIKEGNYRHTIEIIDQIFDSIKKQNLSYNNIRVLYIDLLLLLSKSVNEAGGSWDKIIKEDMFSEAHISQFQTLESIHKVIKECVLSICSYLDSLTKSHSKKVIDEIRQYIDNYYYTEISLNDLASKYYLNPNYLSQLFKSEMNENFVDYLTKVRMDKARELLLNTELKSYRISEMVGYTNPRYFSEVFQKNYGVTPTEFRKNKMGE